MQNKGTDYIRRILRDKARLKRWRQIMLCLSCVVVFCTVYVLILPAITLEKKTTCEEEEQIAIQEEQTPIQEANENTVQSTIPSDDSEDIEFVSCEPIEEEIDDVDNVEITEDPEEEMDVDFASGEEDAIAAAADETVTPEAGTTDGFDLSAENNKDRLSDVKLFYKLPDNENWQEFSTADNAALIPATAKIKLQVEYKDIQIQNLINNYKCKLTYNLPKNPELLRNVTTEGAIFDRNNARVGTVTSESGKIIVTFEETYLNGLIAKKQTTITGNFYVLGDVDLSKLPPENGKTTVSVANKNYYLNFGLDAVAKYGQISVEKTCTSSQVISTESGNYLAYTITVTAGEDGCPDVSVVDTIVINSDCIDSYAGIDTTVKTLAASPNGQKPYETIAEGKNHGTVYLGNTTTDETIPSENASITAPGSMVWKIGNMAAGEIRTLTYYVKLKDKVPLNSKKIINKAEVYSKTYKRTYADKTFEPTIGYNMSKKRDGDIVRNKDGSYTIRYKIKFDLTSNYPLKDFEFMDYLDDESDSYHVDLKALPYISYDRASVKLYKNEQEVEVTDYTVSWAKSDNNYVTTWDDLNGNPTRFKISGTPNSPITVQNGDRYYATYTVTVKPEALAAMKSDHVEVKNRYYVNASNASKKWNYGLDRVYANETVGNYTWDKKVVGSGTATAQTISMSGDKYEYNELTGKPEIIDSQTDTSFTVPAGSYPYTVDVNQTLGDWDATGVSMTDTLSSDKMKYTGYAKVEAREYNSDTKDYEVKDTKWVKIDGLSSFALKPSDLGWTKVNYAYKFTYYAKPVNSNFSEVKVTNTFSLLGNAIRGTGSFPLGGISSQGEVTVSGSFKMNVKKESWYYEEPKTGATTWQNGKLYWVIEVSGTAILKDTYFRDAISRDSGLTDSYLHSDSLAGIYMGTLPEEKTITGYSSLEELQRTGGLTDVTDKFTPKPTNDKNFTGTDNHSELSLKANEKIELGTAKLYFIVRTEPQSLPTKYRDAFTYRNHISTSDNGNTWIDHGSADKLLCGGADILKELGQTFTYDGTTVTSKNDGADKGNNSTIVKDALPGAGQYASWAFKVNYAGELSGTYRVLETIPEGMELAYIRIKWVGGQNFGTINSKENAALEASGWTKKRILAETDNKGQSKTTIYYVKGKQALIELGDFTPGKTRDDYSVDVQVVCRVTDPDVLLGGETKTFTNQVTLQTVDGQDISTATSPAEITPKKIEKTFTTTNPKSEKINFTIEANQFGEGLPTQDGMTLTLIDKLSSSLILDTGSITVIHSKTKAGVDYTASFDTENNTLKIEIPYNVPVTITYTATVDAPPGQSVNFSNTAYWEQYSSSGGDSVKVENYSYAAGGTVSAGANITLNIIKKDQNNLSSLLSGAEFEIIECKRESNGTITDQSGKKWTGTTNVNGVISFGAGSSADPAMDYNTIYKVTETKAPDGYVKNSEPIYIMVPGKEENSQDYSDYVKACIQDSKIHKQYKSTYELTVLNHKGEITVEKKFKDPGGHKASPVSGTYKFGLYENADGTTPDTTTTPLQTITITYQAGEKTSKTEKFVNLDLSKTYYVYELDDNGNPIKDSTTVATVNKMEYFTSYEKPQTAGATTGVNSAVNGDTVTVTNQIRVKELPSTGSYGPLIFRLAGAVLIFFAGLQMLINIKKRACNNR